MESTDNTKTTKPTTGRPSLLNQNFGSGQDNISHARILDALECDNEALGPACGPGKVTRNALGVAALAVLLVGGVSSFFAFGPHHGASSKVVTTGAIQTAGAPQAENPSSAVAAAVPALALASAPSGSDAQIEVIAMSAQATEVPTSTSTAATSQIAAESSALAQRSPDRPAQNKAQAAQARGHARVVGAKKKESANSKKSSATKIRAYAAAATRFGGKSNDSKSAAMRSRSKSDEDADTELVAAIIARLDRRGASPMSPNPGNASADIAGQVRLCASKSDPVKSRHCNNQVCEGGSVQVDACPESRAPRRWRGNAINSNGPRD